MPQSVCTFLLRCEMSGHTRPTTDEEAQEIAAYVNKLHEAYCALPRLLAAYARVVGERDAALNTRSIALRSVEALAAERDALKVERDQLRDVLEKVKQQAGIWKMEARTQRSTVVEVGAELGGIPDYGPIVDAVRALVGERSQQESERDAVIAAALGWERFVTRAMDVPVPFSDWCENDKALLDAVRAYRSQSSPEGSPCPDGQAGQSEITNEAGE